MSYLDLENVFRINSEDLFYVEKCDLDSVIIRSKITEQQFIVKNNDTIWFRQGVFYFDAKTKYIPIFKEVFI
jgi:hypothetical protein